jgi:predicted nucleotidyltransferase
LLDKIEKIVNEIKKHKVRKVMLFGSRARGDNLKNLDIDIAVDGDFSFREKRKLIETVDEVAGIYSVDLVFFDDMSEEFREKVLKEGIEL